MPRARGAVRPSLRPPGRHAPLACAVEIGYRAGAVTFAGLYAIVDLPHACGHAPADVTAALLGDRLQGGSHGAALVQIRAKAASTEERIAWASAMLPVCRRAGAPLVVNDDEPAALAVLADALHLGQTDPGVHDLAAVRRRAADAGHASLKIGISTHDESQLRDATRQRPDYLAFGPIARTRSKADPDPVVGIAGLADACRIANVPVVAIGGLDADLVERAIEVGASAVAVIGALVHPDLAAIRAAAIELSQRIEHASRPRELSEVARVIPVLDPAVLQDLARWADDRSTHLALGLPARFGPRWVDGRALYRPSDVVDLLFALGKRPDETWDEWRARGIVDPSLVSLRAR